MKNIILEFKKKREAGTPISVLTCYDYSFAKILANTGVDCLLVGDSLGMVVQGNDTTLPVTLDEMIYHTKAVKRGAPGKLILADLPFLTYQVSVEEGIRSAGRMMKESGADAIKIEGDSAVIVELTKRLTEIGIPVMSHLGLTPQSLHTLGGYRVQGKTAESRDRMLFKAKELAEAGAFSVLLEMVPEDLGKEITESLLVPTIGIGAGRYMSGQVLVLYDMLGMNEEFSPKFLKKYAHASSIIRTAVESYHKDVVQKQFPGEGNVF